MPKASKARDFLTALALGLIGASMAFLIQHRGYRATIHGTVFVVTKGGEGVKMAGVTVMALNDFDLIEAMKECGTQLDKEFPDFKSRFDEAAASGKSTADVFNKWRDRQERLVFKAAFSGDAAKGAKAKRMFLTTTANVDGKFSFNLSKPGEYSLFAFGERQVNGKTEQYLWVRRIGEPGRGKSYTCDLSNEFIIADEMANEPGLEHLAKGHDLLFLEIMESTYGFQAPNLN